MSFAKISVEHFAIYEKLVFAITSGVLRISIQHIEIKNSIDSKLQTFFIHSVRNSNFEFSISKKLSRKISKNRKMLNRG